MTPNHERSWEFKNVTTGEALLDYNSLLIIIFKNFGFQ